MGYAWDIEPLPSFSIRFSSSHHCCSFSVTHTSHPFIYQYETKVFAKRTSVPLSVKLNVLQCIINIFLSKAQFIYDFSWSCRKWQSSLPLLDGNRNPSLSVFAYSEYVSCKRLQKKKNSSSLYRELDQGWLGLLDTVWHCGCYPQCGAIFAFRIQMH